MKQTTDLFVILTVAVLTALIATPLLSPALSHAEGEEAPVQNPVNFRDLAYLALPDVPASPLVANGLELTVKLDREAYEPGQKPVLTLVAVNKGDKKCKTKATVRMTSTTPMGAFTRAMPMPTQVFEKEVEIEVNAGETKKIRLPTDHAVEVDKVFQSIVSVGELHQLAAAFVVAPPARTEEVVETEKLAQVDTK